MSRYLGLGATILYLKHRALLARPLVYRPTPAAIDRLATGESNPAGLPRDLRKYRKLAAVMPDTRYYTEFYMEYTGVECS